MLIESDGIWVGVSRVDEFEKIPNTATGPDWATLEERLRVQKVSALFNDKTTIEIAAESTKLSPVKYQTVVAAMDVAVKAGFVDVGLSDPEGLSARPHL